MSGRGEQQADLAGETPGSDFDALLALARRGADPGKVVRLLIRRILEIQDTATEAELLSLVQEVRELMRAGPLTH